MAAQISINLSEFVQRDSPFDLNYDNEVHHENKAELDQKLVAAVCTEMMKMLKDNHVVMGQNVDFGKMA